MKAKCLLHVTIFSLFIVAIGFSQQPSNAFVTKTLPNGFSYAVTYNNSKINSASIKFVVRAGFFNESKNEYQAAHILEHIMFSNRQPGQKLSMTDYLRSKGLVFGRDFTASTGFGETIYSFDVDPSDKDLCIRVLEYCKSWIEGFSLNDAAIESERGAVLSELRLSQYSADSRVALKYIASMLHGSTMGKIMAEDAIARVKELKKQDIEMFLKTWYQPDRAFLAISGNVDFHWFDTNIEERFKPLKVTSRQRIQIKYPEVPSKPKIVTIVDEGKLNTDVEFVFKEKRRSGDGSESRKDRLLCQLLEKMENARNSVRGVEKFNSRQVEISLSQQFLMSYTNLRALSAKCSFVRNDSLKNAVKEIWMRLEELNRYGYSKEEFQSAINELKKKNPLDYLTNGAITSLLIQQYLEKVPFRSIDEIRAQELSVLSSISVHDVNKYISEWIDNGRYELVITTAKSDLIRIPVVDSFKQWISQVKAVNIPRPKVDSMKVNSILQEVNLVHDQPDEINVVENKSIGLWQIKIKNGPVIVLRPTPSDPYDRKILMHGFARRNQLNEISKVAVVEKIAPSLIVASGVGTMSQDDLLILSRATNTSVYPYINSNFAGFDGSCPEESFETMLKLAYLYITVPRKDTLVFKNWITQQRREIESRAGITDSVKYYSSLVPGQDFGDSLPLSQLTLKSVFDSYQNVFNTLDNFTIILSGNFEVADVKPLILKYAANIPFVSKTVEEVHGFKSESKLRYPKDKIIRSSAIKDAAKMELRFLGIIDYNERNKATAFITRRIIDTRLFHRLREQEGGTYFVNTGVSLRTYPQASFTFLIGFESSVENKDRLVAAAWEEIERFKREGPTEEEIITARREEFKFITERERTGYFWITYLEAQYKDQKDVEEVRRYPELLKSIGTKEVQSFVQRYLVEANYYQLEIAQ